MDTSGMIASMSGVSSLGSVSGRADLAGITVDMQRQEGELQSFQKALEDASQNGNETELRKACQDFESYFIQTMFREMRKTVHSDQGIFPKGQTETMFQDMLDEEYAKNMAHGKGIGLTDMMVKQMTAQARGMAPGGIDLQV